MAQADPPRPDVHAIGHTISGFTRRLRRTRRRRGTRTPATRGRRGSPGWARPCRSTACRAPARCRRRRRARGCARRWRRRRGSWGSSPPRAACRRRSARPHSQPNWNLLRESSIDHEQLVSISTPRSMRARPSASNDRSPGSRLRLAIRSIGGRFQPSARALATPGDAGARLRDRAAERTLEDARRGSGTSRSPACRRRRSRSSRAPRRGVGIERDVEQRRAVAVACRTCRA